jgi:uncharacterized protein YjbI with pentapeptide repeats
VQFTGNERYGLINTHLDGGLWLNGIDLGGANLHEARLREAELHEANLA